MTAYGTRQVRRYPRNLVEQLIHLGRHRTREAALIVYGDRDVHGNDRHVRYGVLEQRVRAVAAAMQRHGIAPGERALLMLDGNDHYLVAFLACQFAGLIAVPAFPPAASRAQHTARLAGIVQDARPACILTTQALAERGAATVAELGAPFVLAVDTVDVETAGQWIPHEPADDDIAFLQYTSGSTSAPKGVMVSHANLMANQRAIGTMLETRRTDVFVSWLPPFHDMGLIGGLLHPLCTATRLVLMTPESFLERPIRWFEAISRYRGTISGGPDFAYRLCAGRITPAQMASLDLSSWRVALSGAEPVRHDTIEAFETAFGPAGFAADSVYPAYGLAEATLFVTGVRGVAEQLAHTFSTEALRQGRVVPGDEGTTLVSCGRTVAEHELRIMVPDAGASDGRGEIGEIWVRGPSVARGYWHKPAETSATFVEHDGGTWLRTGDLGFLHDDRLFVTGRLKDLIIVRGQNIYPQDIEAAVETQLDVVRRGRIAAFAVEGPDGDGIGLAVEVSRPTQKLVSPDALVTSLSAIVSELCGEGLAVVVLLNPGGLPKTSSGKLQRGACRDGWRARSLDAYAIHERGQFVFGLAGPARTEPRSPGTALEQDLAALWGEVLPSAGGVRIRADESFFAVGGNSVTAVQAATRIADRWEIDFPVGALFEYPQLAACAREIERRQQQEPRRPRTTVPRLSAEARREPLPLSHAQRRLWFLWRLHPESTAYHISGLLDLRGPLDVALVRRSVEAIVARHEALRTLFRGGADGDARQVIAVEPHFDWQVVDLRNLPAALREERRREASARVHDTPFDLSTGPLLRVAVIREQDERFRLALTVHHIVADGWSVQVIIRELAAAYRAFAQGDSWTPVPLPLHYADYAAWQQDWLASGKGGEQLAWWRAQLGDEHPVLELPADHPRGASASSTAGRHTVVMPAALAEAVRGTARAHGASVFSVLLAAFHALLHRLTGQDDIRVGATANNRTRVETEGVVGFFVNLQVQRAVIDGRTTIADLLAQTRAAVLGAQAHQDLPFEQLVDAIQPGRDVSHSPLFRVVINHQQIDHRALETLPGICFDGLVSGDQDARFDLALDTTETAAGDVELSFLFARELFEVETIQRMASQYLRLVEACTGADDLVVDAVPLLDPDERAVVVASGQPHVAHLTRSLPLHRRIAAQAARHPEQVALVDGDTRLPYGALNARANSLAHALAARGIGRGMQVGLVAERSADLVVALLGILKAGAAYVPLDPDYPADRLAYMVADAGLHGVLVQRAVRARMPDAGQVPVFEIEALLAEAGPAHDPDIAVSDADLAYIIYTSGSTGRPKGALLTHGNVTRLLDATDAWFHFDRDDVWTLFHSYAFDFSVWEIFGALCGGGRLVIVPYAVSRSPREFLALLRAQRVTVLNQTPSAFRPLMQVDDLYSGVPLDLRFVIFGGEALAPDDLRPWIERFGVARPALVNMYGITETTVHVTYRPITTSDLGREASPVGVAIPDLGLHVLDARLEPVPVNVPGELHVSGAGLARGYLHRSGLTAERFVADPFDAAGGRLYRTGDLARRRGDGQIEYLGRIDQQVKIRGFRIELGEIESRLRERVEVADAVVMARATDDGGKRLVAWVVPDDAGLQVSMQEEPAALVDQWEAVFDSAYGGSGTAPGFRGWNSSYTDAAIPEPEMREWLDTTVQRIASLAPRRILEIGCGVGLLVERLGPGAARYLATDLSPRAIADLRRWQATQPALSHVELRRREAVEFEGIDEAGWDTIVLNSVAQYFPDADYLLDVLRGAARMLAPGGHIFIGDLRHLAHLLAFHASVQLARASDDVPVRALKAAIARAARAERELVLDPALFGIVAPHLSLGAPRILLRRGHADNELTRYRYDVLLGGPDEAPADGIARHAWAEGPDALDILARRLTHEQPSALRIDAVANRRLSRDLAAHRLIGTAGDEMTVGDLRQRLDACELTGVDPELFWKLGERLGYDASIGWTPGGADGCFDVIFRRAGAPRTAATEGRPSVSRDLPDGWQALATRPRLAVAREGLGLRLREHLRTRLPDYMVPSQIGLLDAMPLTSSGKIDRGALPAIDEVAQRGYEAPAGAMERTLAGVWAEVLGLPRVGRTENFFELGGDSLLSLKVVARAHGAGVPMTPRHLFEHQSVAALAAALERETAPPPPSIARQARAAGQPVPLSHAQQRLWLLWRLQPASSAYHIAGGLRLRGPLDRAALDASIEGIVSRHEALRTTFTEDAGGPVQIVHRELAPGLAYVDLAQHDEPETAARAIAAAFAIEPFDLTAGPLLRVRLLRLAPAEHLVLVAMHHIVSDGWSIELLFGELTARYRACISGKHPAIDALPIQYADYALWQRARLDEGVRDTQLAYWRAHLREPHPVLNLPLDRPRQAFAEYTAAEQAIVLPRNLAERIRTAAQARETTPFVVLLAALQVLLYRYSGQTAIRIGITTANRHHPELAGLIGFFVNTQVLHADLDGRLPLATVLDRARTSVDAAQAHQDLPFDVLVEALQTQRGVSHTPLFQVLHNHLRDRRDLLTGFDGLDVEEYGIDVPAAKFELTLNTSEDARGTLAGSFTYARELFDACTVQRLAADYVTVLDALTADAPGAVADVPIPGAADLALLDAWEAGAGHSARDRTVHGRFERWARATPDAVAIVSPTVPGAADAREVRYGTLDAHANRLAHRLRRLGVGLESRVGISMDRSSDMVAGLLAILKAGGVYVPLDPTYPAERLAFMAADSGISVLLTQAALAPQLPFDGVAGVTVVAVDSIDLSDEPSDSPDTPLHAGSLAYVIYTSGSTGRPKGVEITHGAIARLVDAPGYARLDAAARILQFAPLAFDASTFEIWGALCNGGVLVQAPAGRPTFEALAACVQRHGVDTAFLTTALFNRLVESQPDMLASLRQVLTGGEIMSVRHVREALDRCRATAISNIYGPTECTTFATWHRLADVADARDPVPIGRPIDQTSAYVLDSDLQRVPPGVTGELYLAGPGLARGYGGRRALTAERFVANPFTAGGERLYRTGDRVRWNQSGQIEFLGRSDEQVKIRGFRIEPGEIESALLAQPDVREAVVVVRRAPTGDTLAAYIVGRHAAALDLADLRARLGRMLPGYMMPPAIVALDALPLNANGKIDKAALPEPDPGLARDHEPPQTETEQALAALWRELLPVTRIGRRDDFFELGGHSLSAAQLTSRVRLALGVDVPLRDVFTHPVLSALAALVDSLRESRPAAVDVLPLEPLADDGARTLSPTQRRLWLAERMAGSEDPAAYNVAAGLRLTGALDVEALGAALERIADRHEVLRTIYPETIDGDPTVVVLERLGLVLPVEEVALAEPAAQDARVAQALDDLARLRFDLASGPLLRARLLRLAARRHVLLVSVHHIVCDGWSIAVFLDELAAIYGALHAGQTPSLPALSVRYADYADWQERRLRLASGRHETFWRTCLEGAPALSTWPTDHARPARASTAGDAVTVSISRVMADSLARLAREEGTSVFTVLLAAFQLLLHRRTGTSDLVVGTDVAGRSHPALERLIGFFVNVVPLRTRWAGASTFTEWLAQVNVRTLAAFEHAEVPFDTIVDLSRITRTRRQTPLVQTLFVLQNAPRGHFAVPGLALEIVEAGTTSSKFDLGVFVTEEAGGLQARWVYATSLYDRRTIEMAASAWVDLLAQIVASPTAAPDSFLIPYSEGVEHGSNVIS